MEGSVGKMIFKKETGKCEIKNLIGVPEVKTEMGVNCGKELDIKGNFTYPVVVVERNFELEKALEVKMKNKFKHVEGPNSDKKKYTWDSETDLHGEQIDGREEVLVSHVGSAGLTMFVCVECNKCYNGLDGLQAHICIPDNQSQECNVKENNSKHSLYMCNLCGKSYKNRYMLNSHKNKSHEGHPFFCSLCELAFNCKTLLAKHCKSHLHIKKQICQICKSETMNLAEHIALHHGSNQKKFSCSQCVNSFKSRGELKIHLTVHTTENNYSCAYCKRSFKSRHLIKAHLKYCDNQLRSTYTCASCSQVFTHKHNLKDHMLSIHSNSRPFSCNDCGDTFKHRKYLLVHVQKHTGLKPYTCSFCEKKFAQIPHLKRHERVHTGVKPYLCKLCGKSFRDSSNFKVHQIFHSGQRPFKCTECKKGFTQPSHLKQHMKTHSNERPYVCNICGDAFKQKIILKFHMYRHSDNKPYNCKTCGRSFAQNTHFKRHKCYW